MKKFLLVCVILLFAGGGVYAQNYIFVNSEKVFKSQADYNAAIAQLDTLAKQYQKNVEDAYQMLEEAYGNYQVQRNYLSETKRATKEKELADLEKEVQQYQQDVLGLKGDLMKKRTELIKPIQERVFGAINSYAEAHQYTMVLDVVNNQTLLYYSPSLDKTQDVINLLNK